MKKQSRAPRNKRTKAKKEVSAGAIAFMVQEKTIKVLQLVRNNAFYGIEEEGEFIDIGPKGHIGRGETTIHTAGREIREELGLPLHIDTNFNEEESHSFSKKNKKTNKTERINKKVIYFLAFMNRKDIKQIVLSEEHTKCYIKPIDEAIEQVVFPEKKRILQRARDYINTHYVT